MAPKVTTLKLKQNILVCILLVLFAFSLHYTLTLMFDKLNIFEQFDVLFSADPVRGIAAISYGKNEGDFVHPNFSNLFKLLIKIPAIIIAKSRVTDSNVAEISRAATLLFIPFLASTKTIFVYSFFCLIGLSFSQALLMTFLSIFSFSQLVFASIPEHFTISGVVCAAAYLLAYDTLKHNGKVHWLAWIIVGTLAAAITVTNIIIIGLLLLGSLVFIRRRLFPPLLQTSAIIVFSLLINLFLSFVFDMEHQVPYYKKLQHTQWITKFINNDPLIKAASFPYALSNTITSSKIQTKESVISIVTYSKYKFQFTFEGFPDIFSLDSAFVLFTLVLLSLGTILCFRSKTILYPLSIISLMIIGYNWLLHSVWGDETFLYSQHWLMSELVLLSGILSLKKQFSNLATTIFIVFLSGVVINNAVKLHEIFSLLFAL